MTGLNEKVEDDPRLASLPATGVEGITEAEAARRRAAGMGNDTDIRTGRTYFEIIRENALNPVNVLLTAIAGVLVLLGLLGDAAVTVVLVVVNVVIGFYQQARAKRTLDKLSVLTRPTATIVREGRETVTDQRNAVLGDAMRVRQGDQLTLDGRVIDGAMEVDESLLTGESDRIPKKAGDEVLSGSVCVTGAATYVATRVGAASFANQLTRTARAYSEDQTPIQRDVARVLRALSVVVALTAIPVGISIWIAHGGFDLVESVRAAAVLVALVPQGLVVLVTVTYALAIIRLAGGKALIQRPNAVESMSRVDLLCLDKTGTLTTPLIELVRREVFVPDEDLARGLGDFLASASIASRTADALRAEFSGNRLELVEEVTFSSELRWSGVRFEDGPGFALGAPEVLAPHITGPVRNDILRLTSSWAEEGLRVVAFAAMPGHSALRSDGGVPQIPENLRPMALFALQEQLRPDARETLERLAAAGVRLKLISGDNPQTVAALTRQIGLVLEGPPVSGIDLEALDDTGLANALGQATIFGRVPPSLKARLVEALRGSGYWVAMVGDGVNDVLSLKQAQLGISMQSGSQATRAIADMVLLEDSFSALPAAVVEGQRIISGMQDSLYLFIARAIYMCLVILGAALLGLAIPVSPRHNTVLGLLTVGVPVLFLAVWARPARPGIDSLRRTVRLIIPPAVACALIAVPLYAFYSRTGDVDVARTAFTTFATFCGLGLLPLLEPPVGESISGADADGADVRPTLLMFVLLAVYAAFFLIAPMREFFELVPLPLSDFAAIGLLAVGWAIIVLVLWRVRIMDRVRALLQPAATS